MTKVVNIYKESYDIYCGRAGKGKDGYFGNPFSEGTREENIKAFEEYFYNRIDSDREYRKRVQELYGKTLGCFCKPKSCHCDVYVEYFNKQEALLMFT